MMISTNPLLNLPLAGLNPDTGMSNELHIKDRLEQYFVTVSFPHIHVYDAFKMK